MQSSSVFFLALAAIFLIGTAEFASGRMPALNDENDIRTDDYINYRLPNHTYPEHYDIEFTTNVHTGERAFKGKVVIDVVVVIPTAIIVIHARQLKQFKATITDTLTGVTEDLISEYELDTEFLTLRRRLKILFHANSKWKLTITYEGELRRDNRGVYLSSYTDEEGKKRFLATTHFESTDARHGFPCYDEPAKRANFTITINHSPTYEAISNMPVNTQLSSEGKTVFLTTARIPPHIVGFVVSDFVYTEGVLNGLPQRVYSRPGTKDEQEWALVSGMLITERVGKYYSLDFMLPKLYQVAIPDFADAAMENWGLVTYDQKYLLYNRETSTVVTQTRIASTVAHEICHQWFGDYVTIQWWTYLWLKESFAALLSYRALDDAYPEWGVWQDFHVNVYQKALLLDSLGNPRPMTHYVEEPREISAIYDFVSYDKAASVLHMWNDALTDKVFKRAVHNYLTVNQYSAVGEDHLFTAIQNATKDENYKIPATIQDMMSTWTHQGGYPLLTVKRDYNDGTFTVEQEAFHRDETIKTKESWFIPINYVVASNSDFRNTEATHYLLNVTEVKVDSKISKDDWLILNKQSTGYYSINYDEENWELISNALINRPHKIHFRNRVQLIHDAYLLTGSNRLNHAIFLKMMTYFKKEDQYAPWSTASSIIAAYEHFLNADVEYENFKLFVSELVTPIFEKLGVDDVSGEQHYQKYTRNLVIDVACSAGVKECLEETNNKLKTLVKDNTPIEPNLQSKIYCNGLKQSDDEEFNFVYNELMDSNDPAYRQLLISALACSENENHIKKFTSSSIDLSNKLRTRERINLLNAVYVRGSEVGLLACIEFLNENWQAYGELMSDGNKPLHDDIADMAYYVLNENEEAKLLALVDKVKNSPYVDDTLEEEVKDDIKKNFDWLANHRDPIMSWITKYLTAGNGSAILTT